MADDYVDEYYPEQLYVESIVKAVAYSYKIDLGAPNFIDKAARIFTVSSETPDLATVTTNANVEISTTYRESGDMSEQHLGGSASVGGYYGLAYGSASMSVDTSSSENTRTVRLDAFAKASKYKLSAQGEFRNYPERYLTDAFKEAIKDFGLEKIENKMGHFFALEMSLGGCIQKSYIMDAVEGDTSSSVTGELSATYGAGAWGVTGSASATKEISRGQHKVNMKEEWRAMGGDAMMWLGQDFSNDVEGSSMTELTKNWAATIREDNLFSFDLELIPLWEMIEAVDAKKGKEYKAFLTQKWEHDRNQKVPSYRFTCKCNVYYYYLHSIIMITE